MGKKSQVQGSSSSIKFKLKFKFKFKIVYGFMESNNVKAFLNFAIEQP